MGLIKSIRDPCVVTIILCVQFRKTCCGFLLAVCLAHAGTECSLAFCGIPAEGFSEAGLKDEVDHWVVEGG